MQIEAMKGYPGRRKTDKQERKGGTMQGTGEERDPTRNWGKSRFKTGGVR